MKYVLALLADWANGIFAVLLALWVTGTEVVFWYFLVGIALSHLPNIDALSELWRRGKVAASAENMADHRDGLHYPLIVIPLAASAKRRVRGLSSWQQEDLPAYMRKWGIGDWISPYYLQPSPVSLSECTLFVLAVVLMVLALLP